MNAKSESDYEKFVFVQMGQIFNEVSQKIRVALDVYHRAAIGSNSPSYFQVGEKVEKIKEILETMDRKHL